jgi:hypothetical protein
MRLSYHPEGEDTVATVVFVLLLLAVGLSLAAPWA